MANTFRDLNEGPSVISAEKCHKFAKECIDLAGETPNADVREMMLSMAGAWLELATTGTRQYPGGGFVPVSLIEQPTAPER